jgi:hypothetical protein
MTLSNSNYLSKVPLAGGVTQLLVHLPSEHEALSAAPVLPKKKIKVPTCKHQSFHVRG